MLGIPRDWTPIVGFNPASGIGTAGGYVGPGVATSNLAARSLVDRALSRNTPFTRLPWVHARARRWEPEPFCYLGARLVYSLYRAADRR